MRLRRLVRKLERALAGLVVGFAFACSGPTSPGEMPPLAPRPDPMQPVPSHPAPRPKRTTPVPGAPDPLNTPDASVPVTEVPSPQLEPSAERVDEAPPADAAVQDAFDLPAEVPDALPPDASKRPEMTGFACC